MENAPTHSLGQKKAENFGNGDGVNVKRELMKSAQHRDMPPAARLPAEEAPTRTGMAGKDGRQIEVSRNAGEGMSERRKANYGGQRRIGGGLRRRQCWRCNSQQSGDLTSADSAAGCTACELPQHNVVLICVGWKTRAVPKSTVLAAAGAQMLIAAAIDSSFNVVEVGKASG